MEYLLNGSQMKQVDWYSIQEIGIPSLVLMERAALAVTDKILSMSCALCRDISSAIRILCVCGKGNNGADGMAAARMLAQAGCKVTVLCIEDASKEATDEYRVQYHILENMGILDRNCVQIEEYDYIIDAIFGIGLTRTVTGIYAKTIEQINAARRQNPAMRVVSVDIASGVNASDGAVMGTAVKADETVTFGYQKLGMVLYPGAEFSGNITVADIGFVKNAAALPLQKEEETAYTYARQDLARIPKRRKDADKGKCGKVLIAAGSESMGGAALMSAAASYRSGAGLVRVYTHEKNREVLLSRIPEAIVQTYAAPLAKEDVLQLQASLAWADCVVTGPGLSVSCEAERILETIFDHIGDKALVVDADALNLISQRPSLREKLKGKNAVLTPHVGEMARLLNKDVAAIKRELINSARQLAKELSVICVLKDARTVVTDGNHVYINTTGNAGMATAGSGDVLAGILTGMITAGFDSIFHAAAMAVNIHGISGDLCRDTMGMHGMKAWDLIEHLPQVYRMGDEL